MKGIKEAFIDAGEISQMLGIGMTKASAMDFVDAILNHCN